MCCSGNWVREFAGGEDSVGSGHKFTNTTTQNIDIGVFKTLSWNTKIGTGVPYQCDANTIQTASCTIRNYVEGSAEEKKYLDWFGSLELVGIPQVLIRTNDHVHERLEWFDQTNTSGLQEPLKTELEQTIAKLGGGGTGVADAVYGGYDYYSAASYDNLLIGAPNGMLKKVFSENKFACCLPTGVQIADGTPNSACCTGQASNAGGINRCCLNDFTNLSVYTNRYVSSEGATFNGETISDTDIDPVTGYIKKEKVLAMAGTMCCSGVATYGRVISNLHIPVDGGIIPDMTTRRFAYDKEFDNASETGGVASLFEAGLKWNNHVYCIPANLSVGGNAGGGASQQ